MNPSRRSLAHADFALKVDAWMAAALGDGVNSFAGLLRRLPGVYPTELLASLERLTTRRLFDPVSAAAIRRQSTTGGARLAEGRSMLPPPHPLDFEWRFTADASRSLLDHAADLTPAGGDLLLFGTPGLAVEALTLPIARRLSFLAEANSVTDRVLALNLATGSPLHIAFCNAGLPRESADTILLDPPWYLDFVRPMLAAAAYACRASGFVLVSLPPDGARPSAESDRQLAVDFGRRLGLALSDHQPLAIAYETPFFERNALAAAGIVTPPGWRRGDLMIFRKTNAPSRPPVASGRHRSWTEVVIGRMRLFIRNNGGEGDGEFGLIPIVEGDILPTVSRRDLRRSLADVWTLGNRIFRTDNPQLVLEAAVSCAGASMSSGIQPRLWGTMREREAIERVAGELRDLAALETAEESGSPLAATERSLIWKSRSMNFLARSKGMPSG